MSPPALWLFDPARRWSLAERGIDAVVADRLPAPPGIAARLVDGRAREALRALGDDGLAAPVIALVDDEAEAIEALAAGADAAVSRAELSPGGLAALIPRAAARRRATQRRLRRRAAELGAADETLACFGRSVSHDLRSPLRALDGFGQALMEDFGAALDPDARRYLERMQAATARLDARIDALLALSQMVRRRFEAERVDLGALADEAIERRRAAEPARVVEWTRDPELVVVGDRRLLAALVEALVDNAWRFTAPREVAHIRMVRAGQGFCVADDGVGFGPTYAEQIFHAFGRYHTDAEFPGDGMGLAVARCAVERHGGRIVARGEEGAGAAFAFTLDPDHEQPVFA